MSETRIPNRETGAASKTVQEGTVAPSSAPNPVVLADSDALAVLDSAGRTIYTTG